MISFEINYFTTLSSNALDNLCHFQRLGRLFLGKRPKHGIRVSVNTPLLDAYYLEMMIWVLDVGILHFLILSIKSSHFIPDLSEI